MLTTFAGLDFGTSNSTIGIMKQGKPNLVAVEEGKPTIPSALFFNFEEGRTAFGRVAIKDYVDGIEGRLMRALKSVLGSSLMQESTRIKTREVAFTEIVGMFLANLKACAEREAENEITSVVLGRPVHFVDDNLAADNDAQNQLEQAARAQGFANIAFQFEPIAAALDYEQQVQSEQLALIVDIGGGTSDFSVVRVSPERAKHHDRKDDILANMGVHIGGTDFDRLLSMAAIMPLLGMGTLVGEQGLEMPRSYYRDLTTWQRINSLYTKQVLFELRQLRHEAAQPDGIARLMEVIQHRQGHALAGNIEAAKIALTNHAETAVDMQGIAGLPRIEITRTDFHAAIAEASARITYTAQQTVSQAGLTPDEIQAVFLTGGSTQIPLVKASILALFPQAKVVEGDMFGSVGLGLTLDAQRTFF